MPEIIYHVASSLDGFIADVDDKVDWLNNFNAFEDKEVMDDFQKLMSSFDGILLGGKTYDFVVAHGKWMAAGTPTWVFTSRELPALDPCIQVTNDSPEKLVKDIASKKLKRIWLMGGGKLAASFLNAGLIDEVNLTIAPTMLGQGIPLIGKTKEAPKLTLSESKSYANGFVSVRYLVG